MRLKSEADSFWRKLFPVLVNRFSSGERSEDFLVEKMAELEEAFQGFDEKVEVVQENEMYLTSQKIDVLEQESEEVMVLLKVLSSQEWESSVDGYVLERFEEIKTGFENYVNFLEGYNEAFVERELERFDYLFEKGEYSLNAEQRRAVVRNDTYNRVVAGAGAGKTLVLIYRIAYLVEKGFEPGDIVALTLTKQACNEVKQRLANVFGIEDVEVRTFHSLGYKFYREGSKVKSTVVDRGDMDNFIEEELRDLRPGTELENHLRKFLYFKDTELVSCEDFEEHEAFIEARAESSYRTLNREKVKSESEKLIADFLFTHGINYRYEDLAEWAETSKDHGEYFPDFYLPEHDLYIEHWGIREDGEVPEWFSWDTERYKEKMDWARSQFTETDHSLVETFDEEFRKGQLEGLLRDRLEQKGVKVEALDIEELVEKVGKGQNGFGKLGRKFCDFIQTAKMFDTGPGEIDRRLTDTDDMRKYHFGAAGKILLERYEKWLQENSLVDFQDMIYASIEKIRSNPQEFSSRYEHVLVDEFQDVAKAQIELVDLLTGEDAAKLF